ncbi:hypothetical protein [Arthrobacter sp. UYCu712]|uniref:hypothetical protein n=1 Tax=Arthrobacter sp. UYCu712 TaxID=3156340 RepID=UPI00339A3D24
MIIYRPIAPLTTGRTGLMPALAAVALTAVLGTTWQDSDEFSGPSDITGETAPKP